MDFMDLSHQGLNDQVLIHKFLSFQIRRRFSVFYEGALRRSFQIYEGLIDHSYCLRFWTISDNWTLKGPRNFLFRSRKKSFLRSFMLLKISYFLPTSLIPFIQEQRTIMLVLYCLFLVINWLDPLSCTLPIFIIIFPLHYPIITTVWIVLAISFCLDPYFKSVSDSCFTNLTGV